jgi:hypothetical protein
MGHFSRLRFLFSRGVFSALVLVTCLAATRSICLADACAEPPADQDPNDADGPDNCFTGSFKVPADPYDKSSGGYGGWGALVLTFNKPIDGASFVFDPQCDTPADGFLSADKMSVGLGPAYNANGFVSGKGYRLGATGTQVPGGDPTDIFQDFVYTIRYDGNVAPNLVSGFWQAKPKDPKAGEDPFTANYSGQKNSDLATVPEPSYLPPLLLGSVLLLAFWRRRKTQSENA